MKKFVLFVSVLFFGLVKPKAQFYNTALVASTTLSTSTTSNCYWKTGNLFSDPQPIELIKFHGKMGKSKLILEWTIASNESANLFEVEKSINGKDFATTGLVFSSEKQGTEQYAFFEKAYKKKIFYRLKLIDKANTAVYSNVLTFYNEKINEAKRIMNGNKPVFC